MRSMLAGFIVLIGFQAEAAVVSKVVCTEIREEPGAPTYSYELVRARDGTYTARYLNLPGDESAPPEVVAEIGPMACKFRTNVAFLHQCSKMGASIEGLDILERKLSLIRNSTITTRFREFRATGNDVPGVYLVFRFGPASTCKVTRK